MSYNIGQVFYDWIKIIFNMTYDHDGYNNIVEKLFNKFVKNMDK